MTSSTLAYQVLGQGNPWQIALLRTQISRELEEDVFSPLSLGSFKFLRDLPSGVEQQVVTGCPKGFPTLTERQIVACHIDRLLEKPLIACFSQRNIEQIEEAYQKGFLSNRDWVILTVSETAFVKK